MVCTHAAAALLSKKKTTAQTVMVQFSVKCTTGSIEDFKFICLRELAFIIYMTALKPHTNEYYLGYSVYHGRVWLIVHVKYN